VQVLGGRPLHVVGDHEVELAVLVVVEEGGAGREAGVVGPRLLRDVGELSVAQVAVEAIAPPRRQVDVDKAVVVVVGGGHPDPVEALRKPRLHGDVGEGAVVVVAIEGGGGFRPLAARPARGVDQEQVLPAVVVEIQEGPARADRLRQELLSGGPAVVDEADLGGRGHVGELDIGRAREGGGRGKNGDEEQLSQFLNPRS
jgi:hypothetical protein